MIKTEPVTEVVAAKKDEQFPLEPLTLLPKPEDAKAELRKTINRLRTK